MDKLFTDQIPDNAMIVEYLETVSRVSASYPRRLQQLRLDLHRSLVKSKTPAYAAFQHDVRQSLQEALQAAAAHANLTRARFDVTFANNSVSTVPRNAEALRLLALYQEILDWREIAKG